MYGQRLRIDSHAVAFFAKCGNGAGMSKKSSGVSYQSQQLIEIVRSWRAVAGLKALFTVYIVQQSELPVVDQLMLLPLPQRFDRQAQLLLHLVHRLVIQIGHPAMD